MNRRRALACVGSALLAGCLSESTPRGSEPTTLTTRSPQATRTTNSTITTTEHPQSHDPETDSPNLDVPNENHCPPFSDDEKQVVCYQDADPGTTLLMKPSKERVTLPKASLSFTLRNETGATFTTNYYAWRLWKQVEIYASIREVVSPRGRPYRAASSSSSAA